MSYFLLPKNNNNIDIDITIQTTSNILTSCTLSYYFEQKKHLQNFILNDDSFKNIQDDIKTIHIINPYQYIFSNIPVLNISISKLKTKTILFYDLIEINQLLFLFENLYHDKTTILNISPNFEDFEYYVNRSNDKNLSEIFSFSSISIENSDKIKDKMYDFIFFEDDTCDYKSYKCIKQNNYNIMKVVCIILKCQSKKGNSLIKIQHIFNTHLIEILYLLSSLFENVYIVKPTTSNMATFEKYIFCKNYNNKNKKTMYNTDLSELIKYWEINNKKILSIISNPIPCYFLNKIQDLNSVLLQQQLETLEQLINNFKIKNKEEKIESLKKYNIQKSMTWCDKYKIPYNKIIDKINIFLPMKEPVLKSEKEYVTGMDCVDNKECIDNSDKHDDVELDLEIDVDNN